MLHLDLSLGVLVNGEAVDHAHGVFVMQALELGDDLAVEVRVLEPQDYELYRSDCHSFPFGSLVHQNGRARGLSGEPSPVADSDCAVPALSPG